MTVMPSSFVGLLLHVLQELFAGLELAPEVDDQVVHALRLDEKRESRRLRGDGVSKARGRGGAEFAKGPEKMRLRPACPHLARVLLLLYRLQHSRVQVADIRPRAPRPVVMARLDAETHLELPVALEVDLALRHEGRGGHLLR